MLRALLMMTVVTTADALSLPSPMSFLMHVQFPLHGLSVAVISFLIVFFMCASAVVMMPYVAEPEPEMEMTTSRLAYHKVEVYGFLCVCVKHSLFLIDDAEYGDDHAKVTALNSIYDSLMDL